MLISEEADMRLLSAKETRSKILIPAFSGDSEDAAADLNLKVNNVKPKLAG